MIAVMNKQKLIKLVILNFHHVKVVKKLQKNDFFLNGQTTNRIFSEPLEMDCIRLFIYKMFGL